MSKQWKKVPILNTKKRTPKTYKNVEQHRKTHPEIPDTYVPPPQKRRDEYRNVLRQKMVNGELITYNLFIIYIVQKDLVICNIILILFFFNFFKIFTCCWRTSFNR